MYYGYIRLHRVIDQDGNIIEEELKKLGEFIKHRSSINKDLSYYTITFIEKGDIDGYIIVGGEEDKVIRELELINGFIDSSFSSLSGKIIDKYKYIENLPLPKTRNFY